MVTRRDMLHPIRTIKEKIGSAIEEIAVTAPQLVKDAVVAAGDQAKVFNETILEPTEQQWAEEHGYTHGGRREKIVKHLMGVSKYEAGAQFLSAHIVEPMRSQPNQANQTNQTTGTSETAP